jgi:two-component system, NarL family, sensor histidine kinase DesK
MIPAAEAMRSVAVRSDSGPTDAGGRDLPPRLARMIVLTFLCLFLAVKVADALHLSPLGSLAVTGMAVVPFLYAVRVTRPWVLRHRWSLLALQAGLTYWPFAVFGGPWIAGTSGLLTGLALLILPGRAAWFGFAGLLVVESAIWAGLALVSPDVRPWQLFIVVMTPVTNGLSFFGLSRLADLVTTLYATRTLVAATAAAAERSRAVTAVRTATGDRMGMATAKGEAALRALQAPPFDAAAARGHLVEVAAVTRAALADVRSVGEGQRPHEYPEPPTLVLAPKLARSILVTILVSYAVLASFVLFDGHPDAVPGVAGVIVVAAISALTLYQSTRGPSTVALLAQGALFVALISMHGWRAGGMAGVMLGSVWLALRGRWALSWVAAGATIPFLWFITSLPFSVVARVYTVLVTLIVALVVFGLSRLDDLTLQVVAVRRELTRVAIVAERERVARDVHDLLGLGLSAVAVKSDLVIRLLDRRDSRAGAELEELLRITRQVHLDLRSGTDEDHPLRLDTEVRSAATMLAAAGIVVTATPVGERLPADVDAVLATVLREAVTNVLRHAAAGRCAIGVSTADGAVHLRVANDGVPAQPETSPDGRGLVNLSTRVEAIGGRFTAAPDGLARFEVRAEVPLRGQP